MKKMFFAAAMLTALFTSCDGGKEVLFNGQNLDGWVLFVDPTTDVKAEDVFSVKDGVISVTGMPYGYMRTAKKYADYVAHAEFRWTDGKGSNSGFFQRVQEGDKIFPTDVEVQLKVGYIGDLMGSVANKVEAPGGPQRVLRLQEEGLESPVGEWNIMEVKAEGTHLTVTLNGKVVNEAETDLTEGFIGLQSEGGPLEFKNVWVKEIKPATGAPAPEVIPSQFALFNGRNLNGWTLFTDPSSDVKAEEVFTVKDGLINVSGNPFGYMRTNRQFDNYRLHVEWRWVDEKATKNSGCFQRVQPGDKVWPAGAECQLADGNAGMVVGLGGYKIEGAFQNGEFGIKPRIAEKPSEKPFGEWNEADIECVGKHMVFKINGVVQNEADGEFERGYIALQSEGGPLQFRNVTILELK